jgi:superfamily II DNA or RNA helicase
MRLSEIYRQYFDSAVRSRGAAYLQQGAVRIQFGDATELQAVVRGSRRYEVSLYLDQGHLVGSCDCPYYDSEGYCKHLWACLLAADARGHLTAVSPRSSLVLESSPEDGPYYLDEEEHEEDDFSAPAARRAYIAPAKPPAVPPPPDWRKHLESIAKARPLLPAFNWPAKREIFYVVQIQDSASSGCVNLSLLTHDRKMDGTWGKSAPLSLDRNRISSLPLAEDRDILWKLAGVSHDYGWGSYYANNVPPSCQIPQALERDVVRSASLTGRCCMRLTSADDGLTPLAWDDGGEWSFGLELRSGDKRRLTLSGVFRRGEERMQAGEPLLVTRGGLVFTGSRVAFFAVNAAFEWLLHMRQSGDIEAPERDCEDLLQAILCAPDAPALDLPDELRYEEIAPPPKPWLKIRAPESSRFVRERLHAELCFDYDGTSVPAVERSRGFYEHSARRFTRRDAEAERAATALLGQMGFRFEAGYYEVAPHWELASTKLPRAVRALVEAGWRVEADGKLFRRPAAFHMEVSSGVDWFELKGGVRYGEDEPVTASLPELLEALRKGEKMVRLGDGTYGVLPEEWLGRIGMLAGMGAPVDGHLRFNRSQAGLLDVLLTAEPEARFDETFARVREELHRFEGVEAAEQPDGFAGKLRDYQREGLGWLHFLRRFSFGGCLADDMGVGKTAQALALLETRRELRAAGEPIGPSLVVVPRSLVFNWKEEAARFTPRLTILDYTGTQRSPEDFARHDVIVTTYGTLRRDILRLKKAEFDYVILDEAQAIKNAGADTAKAARLLRGAHRLALSGTPVENHLGELWSLFEFLNPGMLGTASVFRKFSASTRNPDDETRRMLGRALRPFILRRTKQQVARELPPKTEQIIYCEMECTQRRLYDDLRRHYRNALLKRIDDKGLAKAKIQVLEALLRLRQAACHPGLLDAERSGESSAKLDSLLEQLREVLDEGHKALVFSQFTSLLAIVRTRLDESGVVYEYLDGATRDRQTCVERFQNDSGCPLFLVSLKAGGLGLNLTAAEYVFLLDPWWNPAVEAQAVDRAHRIGQTKKVFAYRLITRDTVEERVLELQKTKRDLAAAIVGEDNSLIRDLKREDLELLLS